MVSLKKSNFQMLNLSGLIKEGRVRVAVAGPVDFASLHLFQ